MLPSPTRDTLVAPGAASLEPCAPAGASMGPTRASCCPQQVARKLVVLEGELERSEERAEVAER